MRRAHFLSVLLLSCIASLPLHAQRELQNPLIDSKEVIRAGVELHDSARYKEAVAAYLKVPPSDTAYALVLHELMLSYYADSNFVEAEKYAHLALQLYPSKSNEWYSFLADVYDDTKRTDMAIQAYDTILARNPYQYLAYFNRGISLFRQAKYDEATRDFQQCLMLNPFYTSAHYFLGQLALLKGNLVPAMMSFATNLLIAPENRYRKASLNFLVTISEVNTTATGYLQKYKPGKEDNFDDVQEILISKASLDKKYKLKAALDDQIVRQLQVVLEKLEFNAGDKGFWMQYYVPLFKSIWDKEYFEQMVFHMFSELNIKKVDEYVKKEKKKIGVFTDAASAYLSEIRESQELIFNKRATAPVRYYIKKYLVNGKGSFAKNSKNEEIVTGPWEFYHENGKLKSKGVFDPEGGRTGEWRYYFDDGTLKEISLYANDKASGKSLSWFENGLPSTISNYKDDLLDGEETNYFYSGMLSSVVNYKNGKKDGLAKYYNIDGYLRTVTNYTNDLQEGDETVNHPNGKIYSSVKYVKDLPAGEYKEYFDNGKIKMSGNFVAGKKTAVWNTYYIDGKTEEMENYVDGELDGEMISYYTNGKVASRRAYRKGEVDGKKEDFDEDGIVFSEAIFERGRLRDIKFFDKKGTVISNTTSRKGNADISFYGPHGSKQSQGYYTKDGLAEGKFTEYFRNGSVSAEGRYKDGLPDGKKTSYFSNSKVLQEGMYKANKADGYFVNYYNNGQVSEEGWYVDGLRQGTFLDYDLLGHLTSKLYYLNDKVHGIAEYYSANGKLDYKQYFANGWLYQRDQYDSTGKAILLSSSLKKGSGKMGFNHFNGKPYVENNFEHYQLEGKYAVFNADGSRASVSYYKHGQLDSLYTAWHPNGKIMLEGRYAAGNKTGTWKYYYYNGQLYETEEYADGKQNGPDVQYDEAGAKDKEYNYKDGQLEGEMRMYGDNNQLMLVFYYLHGYLTGYSYEDKTGKLVPMIPLEKSAGTVDGYYKNGVKSAHMVFDEGSVEGERKLYSTTGKEQAVSTRINGDENGSKKIYYPDGKIMLEENYYYGQRHGGFKYYSENGALIYDINYYLGSLHGDCKYYTAGKLTQTYTYHYGLLEAKK